MSKRERPPDSRGAYGERCARLQECFAGADEVDVFYLPESIGHDAIHCRNAGESGVALGPTRTSTPERGVTEADLEAQNA